VTKMKTVTAVSPSESAATVATEGLRGYSVGHQFALIAVAFFKESGNSRAGME
jgi:hypothetical protein